jgi:tetratricopeptide (TPR) repeat protein
MVSCAISTMLSIDDLNAELGRGPALVIVGAGVSVGATAGTPGAAMASWGGLLRHGVDWCTRFAGQDEGWAAPLRGKLDHPASEDFLEVGGALATALRAPRGGSFRSWLEQSAGALRAADRSVLDALRDLGLPLATTNYDGLLEEATGRPSFTWRQPGAIEDLLHGGDPGILHLHGHWSDPESVVLDPESYRRLGQDAPFQALFRALRATYTFLFVGFGSSLADPNWGPLLGWAREVLAGSTYLSFRLSRGKEVEEVQRQHPLDQRILAVSYGAAHPDLGPFVRRLRSPWSRAASPPLPPAPRLFGRDEEVADLVAVLDSDAPRPAAVLGGPGVGKTTLTLAVLHHPRVAARFGTRRYFVPCEGATGREALIRALAAATALRPGPEPEPRLLRELERRPSLVVLDNLETPWDVEPRPVEELLARLAAVPGIALAVSLRSNVRPTGVGWHDRLPLPVLEPAPARTAFLEIAGGVYRNDPDLDPLLQAVGYLPLAISLLAYAAAGSPLAEVRRRWQIEKAAVLRRDGGGHRLTDVAASVRLSLDSPRMTAAAKRLLSVLALLPDGLAPEDFGALFPGDHDAAALLRRVGLAQPYDPRLRLLAPIREVLHELLPADPPDRDRVVQHFLDLASLGERVGGAGGAEAARRLAPELGNLESVLSASLEASSPEPAIEAALRLTNFILLTGLAGTAVLERALPAARNSGLLMLAGRCAESLGNIAFERSDHDAARARYQEALPLYRQVGSLLGEANCIKGLGDIALGRSDHDTARARYQEALPLYRQVGDLLGQANCIQRLGDIAFERSDHDAARARYQEALPLYRQVGSLLGEANCIKGLGDIALGRSDHDTARARYQEALTLYRQAGDLLGEANCIQGLGNIALERSDHDTADTRYQEALPLYRQVGALLGEANCIQGLGDIALRRDDRAAAGARFAEALALYRRIPEPYSMGWSHVRLARLGDGDEKLRHLEAARAAWTGIDRPDLISSLEQEFGPLP